MKDKAILELVSTPNARIPVHYRQNKAEAAKLISRIKGLNIPVFNRDVLVLSRWCGEDINGIVKEEQHSEVESIVFSGEELTVDMSVPNGHSFSGNGMFLHNCNLPNDVSEDVVAEVYMKAWEEGCKGFTVYRDGCRSGVLINDSPKTSISGMIDQIRKNDAPKRPANLPCDVHHIKVVKKGKVHDYLVIVGLLKGDPYEVFIKENGTVDKKYTHGKIIKKSGHVYVVEFEDGNVIHDLTKNTTDEEDSLTRMTSTAMRHGADISFIVQQLEKAEGDAWSYSKAIARALKKYIKDGIQKGETCPKCQSKDMERKEGCKTCLACGWSGCG